MHALVVTPVANTVTHFLPELATSFHDGIKTLPDTITLTWQVQIDGPNADTHTLTNQLRPLIARTNIALHVDTAGRQRGPAYTRTLALLTAHARQPVDIVTGIDADDYWLPTGLAQLLAPFTTNAAWVAGAHIWVDENGTITDTYQPVDDLNGPLPPGKIRHAWTRDGTFPFAAACAAYRAPLILKRGGWPSSPTGEDAVLLLAISDTHPGYAIPTPVFAYRAHTAQSTKTTAHTQLRQHTYHLMRHMAPHAEPAPDTQTPPADTHQHNQPPKDPR